MAIAGRRLQPAHDRHRADDDRGRAPQDGDQRDARPRGCRDLSQRDSTVRQMRRFIGDASHELRTPARHGPRLRRALPHGRDQRRRRRRTGDGPHREGGHPHGPPRRGPARPGAPRRTSRRGHRPGRPAADRTGCRARRARGVAAAAGHGDRHHDRAARPSRAGADPEPDRGSRRGKRRAAAEHVGHRPCGRATLSLLRRKPRPGVGDATRPAASELPSIAPVDSSQHADSRPGRRAPIVRGDENRIRQVVANLLGNARRFTHEDSPIELRVGVDHRRPHGVDRGRRPRRGHPRPDQGEDLPAVLARRHVARPRDRRHRARAVDRGVDRRGAARVGRRRRHPRRRRDVPGRLPARRGAGCRRAPPPRDPADRAAWPRGRRS